MVATLLSLKLIFMSKMIKSFTFCYKKYSKTVLYDGVCEIEEKCMRAKVRQRER